MSAGRTLTDMAEGSSVGGCTLVEVIQGTRALLEAIDAGRMSCSSAYRNRLPYRQTFNLVARPTWPSGLTHLRQACHTGGRAVDIGVIGADLLGQT
ncbi:MAG: hypothetical protein ACRDRR_18630 [Pseudonocardiaceae bacterium]